MKQTVYKSYDELPLMLSVPGVAAVLGITMSRKREAVFVGIGIPGVRNEYLRISILFHTNTPPHNTLY